MAERSEMSQPAPLDADALSNMQLGKSLVQGLRTSSNGKMTEQLIVSLLGSEFPEAMKQGMLQELSAEEFKDVLKNLRSSIDALKKSDPSILSQKVNILDSHYLALQTLFAKTTGHGKDLSTLAWTKTSSANTAPLESEEPKPDAKERLGQAVYEIVQLDEEIADLSDEIEDLEKAIVKYTNALKEFPGDGEIIQAKDANVAKKREMSAEKEQLIEQRAKAVELFLVPRETKIQKEVAAKLVTYLRGLDKETQLTLLKSLSFAAVLHLFPELVDQSKVTKEAFEKIVKDKFQSSTNKRAHLLELVDLQKVKPALEPLSKAIKPLVAQHLRDAL